MKTILALPLTTVACCAMPIDLSGVWELRLDSGDQLVAAPPASWVFDDSIALPGTTDLAGKGGHVTRENELDRFLTREWEFVGPAFYKRRVSIPADWGNAETELHLERVMWQSRVWVDGREVSPPADSLNTPHLHRLGKLAPGGHDLVIRVDNRMIHPIGDKGHAYGSQTQSVWNGIVGKIELRPVAGNRIDFLRVFAGNDGNVKVEVNGNFSGHSTLSVRSAKSGREKQARAFATAKAAGARVILSGKAESSPETWSGFTPAVYHLTATLTDDAGNILAEKSTTYGFREIRHEGNRLLLNGTPAFMRGNLECAVFPRTGHPPVSIGEWRRIWKAYKLHNLNHARFHSWCPPEAAFTAADEEGILLQVEAPIWIDGWMTRPNKRRDMDTPGYPQGLGRNDRSIDTFAQAEIRRTLDTYGNHPSFVFFCFGNELGTSDFAETGRWVEQCKAYDGRHLYAASTARAITPFCDFNVTHNIPNIGGCRQHVEFGTAWDYEKQYGAATVPIIAHEIGQWPVYVDWETELPKYTGPLKPYRLRTMADDARENGLYDRAATLRKASGESNRILYRYEIESFLRTPSCRGFQLLSMQDYSGQGEALVGWLDSFYESKGTTDPADFRNYCAPIVPLLRLPGFVFKPADKPEIEAVASQYGPSDLKAAAISWTLVARNGVKLSSGMLPTRDLPKGGVVPLGKFTPDFSGVKQATQAKLTLTIVGAGSNAYDLWIYPDTAREAPSNVEFTSDWESAREALAGGRSVVLSASLLGGGAASRHAGWMPLYWSVPFFPGQGVDTIGLLVQDRHPALAGFPTPSHADWNWFRICRGARGFDLTELTPPGFRGIAEPVSDFHLNRRLASIFEVKSGKGRLLVSGYDITGASAEEFPETAALRHSLLAYAASGEFAPQTEIAPALLDKLFENPDLKLPPLPAQFARADLYVSAAAKLPAAGRNTPWKKAHDAILRRADGVDYKITAGGAWRDDQGHAWHGRQLGIEITPRSGVPGTLWLRFADWSDSGRTGTVTVEEKTVKLGAHVSGEWLRFPMIREDSNDGRFIISAETVTGPNLMLTDIAFVPAE